MFSVFHSDMAGLPLSRTWVSGRMCSRALSGERVHIGSRAGSDSRDSRLGFRILKYLLSPWSGPSGRGPREFEESGEEELKTDDICDVRSPFLPSHTHSVAPASLSSALSKSNGGHTDRSQQPAHSGGGGSGQSSRPSHARSSELSSLLPSRIVHHEARDRSYRVKAASGGGSGHQGRLGRGVSADPRGTAQRGTFGGERGRHRVSTAFQSASPSHHLIATFVCTNGLCRAPVRGRREWGSEEGAA